MTGGEGAALSRPGGLLFSYLVYLVISNQFADFMSNTPIYRPKRVRVSTAFLFSR